MSNNGQKTRIRKKVVRVCFWLTLCVIMFVFLFPFIWVVTTSFKQPADTVAIPPKVFFQPTIDNYVSVINSNRFEILFRNSLITSVVPVFISLLLGTPAAYALGQLQFANKSKYSLFILIARIMPPMAILFPMYVMSSKMKLIGSFLPLFITYTMFILPQIVWLLPVYFKNIPSDLREAAIIDGCSEWGVFVRIMMPLVKPGLTATIIFSIIQAWNEFLFALIFTNRSTQTLAVNIISYLSFEGPMWGPMCAAGTIIMLPMVIFGIIIQNNFVKGMTVGAVKG